MHILKYLGFIFLMILGFSGCGPTIKHSAPLTPDEYNKFPSMIKINQNMICVEERLSANLKKDEFYPLYDFSNKKLGSLITLPEYAIGFKVGEIDLFNMNDYWDVYIFLNENGERLFDDNLFLALGSRMSKDYDFRIAVPDGGTNGNCVDSNNNEIKNLKFEIVRNKND